MNMQGVLLVPTQAGEQLTPSRTPVPTLPLARNTDPKTSEEAARVLQENPRRLGRLQERALILVERYPGRTANEYERMVESTDPTQDRSIARRLSDLEHATKIHRSGSKVDPESGRKCECWWPGPDPPSVPSGNPGEGR
jgi:hypothetical protein